MVTAVGSVGAVGAAWCMVGAAWCMVGAAVVVSASFFLATVSGCTRESAS